MTASFLYVHQSHNQITLDATPELQNKHTIFGRVAGPTIYNALALANVELSDTIPDRPVFPPKLFRAEVIHNPFSDLVPRTTPEERAAQREAKRLAQERDRTLQRQSKKAKKNTTLLSFGDEEDTPAPVGERKPMSSHDLLEQPLRKKGARGQPSSSASSSSVRPDLRLVKPDSLDSTQREAHASIPAQASLSEGEHHSESSTKEKTGPIQQQGDLLGSILRQYKKTSTSASEKTRENETISKLQSFQTKIRERAVPPASKAARDTTSHLNEWDDEEDMREYGASDEDDDDWRSHKYVCTHLTLDLIQAACR